MSIFVFRNNTIERFFPREYTFSGYEDISSFPQEAEGYVWWYQAPLKTDRAVLAEQIDGYIRKLGLVLSSIDEGKPFIALTMDVFFDAPYTDDDHRLDAYIDEYNLALYDVQASRRNLKVIDITEFTRRYPSVELLDWKFYFISQMGMNPRLADEFKKWWKRKLDGIALKRKKCLVLDLDNTLWGGILGEDGIDGIRIGGGYPGNAFLYWQESLLQLSENGVILAVCSKNNEKDVLEVWEKNPYLVLRKEHFAAWRINWEDKATNLMALAEELNIGLDSIVFVDDNPSERQLVRQMLPMVVVPDFPERPYGLPEFFRQMAEDYFRVFSITEEDRDKTLKYKQNAQRMRAQEAFSDFQSYLRSLDIRITIEKANGFNISRIAQMTQKTNQFNLTTHRYTESDINAFLKNGWRCWCIGVSDRFGDNGITGAVMVKPGGEVDSFLLSCRILGKGIEFAFIRKIHALLAAEGFKELKASYLPTSKNAQVRDFYEKAGYTCISESADGAKAYLLKLKDADTSVEDYYEIVLK